MSKVAVRLKPTPGFCIKAVTAQPAVYKPISNPDSLELENEIPIPQGFKVFVNIAWDEQVPAPPEANEEVIQRAMKGEEVGEPNSDAWYVPVVVSEGRLDTDKAGKPSLVFDCVFNKSIKSRILRDPEFKLFIIELALQRIEAQTPFILSREIGTPNIAAKGKLLPRTVQLPQSLRSTPSSKPLIEEIPKGLNPKGVLKSSSLEPSKLTWTWANQDGRLEISVPVPGLTRDLIAQTTLDLEPRRMILQIPGVETLDVNLNLSDAEIVATSGTTEYSEAEKTLMLKRQRKFNVDGASAEWRVAERRLFLTA